MILDRATGNVEHGVFRDLPGVLRPQDCLVLNKTQVVPAKFTARRATGGRITGLFIREERRGHWDVMLNGAKRLKPNERMQLGESEWSMEFLRRRERGFCDVRIDPGDPASVILGQIGMTPLPPYIRRDDAASQELRRLDHARYQTVYAAVPGAVAAPTAGMHFTDGVLNEIHGKGVSTAEVVLHVGLGTFQPIEVDDLSDHAMHREWFDFPESSVDVIGRSRAARGRILAVGTTVVRVLETCAQEGRLQARNGWTDILIYPPFTFRATDLILTNFHLPGSTLLALVSAFAGRELVMEAYGIAIREGYRFYSYGDAMLIM